MKILFISERFPWPLEDGGNLRTFQVLNAICKEHEVTLLSHAPKENADGAVRELEKFCHVRTIEAPSRLKTAARVMMQPWRWNESLFVLKNWSSVLFKESQKLLETKAFDVVHFNHLDTAAFSEDLNYSKSVFDSHNCISAMAEQLAENRSSGWKKLIYRRESKALAAKEKEVCDRCDIVLACSQQDRDSFLRLSPAAKIHVVPNGAVIESKLPTKIPDHAAKVSKIVFVGAMDYSPNVVGVEWFCNQVLPIIRQRHPQVLFQIVGRNPTNQVLGLHDVSVSAGEQVGVEVTGRVESVGPYLENAAVVVVPLLDGGGTRLKILEAFAAKRPVVSTAKGAEGIDAEHKREVLIADESTEFAASVLRLLSNSAEAMRIGNAGYRLAKQRYDWSSIQHQILNLYETFDSTRRHKATSPRIFSTSETAKTQTVTN